MPEPRQPQPVLRPRARSPLAILLWRALALVSFVVGVAGVLLPVLPGTPFLILAAWAAGKGWPAFEAWLLRHPWFGPHVVRWRARNVIPLPAKWAASIMMVASALALQWTPGVALWLRVGVPLLLLAVALWIWTRPHR